VDYVLNRWELDGSPVGSANSYDVLMNSPHTLHAVFEYSPPPPTEYYPTVKTNPLSITTIPGESWYEESTSLPLTAPAVAGYIFLYWDVNGVT
jgi:hypothetical protein